MLDDRTDGLASGANDRSSPSPVCSAVDDHLLELLARDLPSAMRRELEPHVERCGRCRHELATFAQLVAELTAAPTLASVERSWELVRVALLAERRERVATPWLVQVVLLAAAALLVSWVGHTLAIASSWRPWLLPTIVLSFGAAVALAAFPLLSNAARSTSTRLVPCSK